MWFIAELELSCHHIEFGGSFGRLNNEECRAMNPHGRVPVIDDGGIIVWESHAILRYLAARYGSPKKWRSGHSIASGQLDGLGPNGTLTEFLERRILGILSNAWSTKRYDGGQCEDSGYRLSSPTIGSCPWEQNIPSRNWFELGGYSRRNHFILLF